MTKETITDEIDQADELHDETAHLAGEWTGTAELENEETRAHVRDPNSEPDDQAPDPLKLKAEQDDNEAFYEGVFKPLWAMPSSIDPAFGRLAITPEKDQYARPASDELNKLANYLFPDLKEKKSFLGRVFLVGQFGMIQWGCYQEAMGEIRARHLDDQRGDPRVDGGELEDHAPPPGTKSPLEFMDVEGRA